MQLQAIGELPEGTAGKSLTDFKDAGRIAPWAKEAVELFVITGVISGSRGMLFPEATSSRAQMTQLLYNILAK